MVVDELHMVADADRGIVLEMSLSKLMFSPHARHVQVIGMSATSELLCCPAAVAGAAAAGAGAGSAVGGWAGGWAGERVGGPHA